MKHVLIICSLFLVAGFMTSCGGGEEAAEQEQPPAPTSAIASATSGGVELEGSTVKASNPIVVTLSEAAAVTLDIVCDGESVDMTTTTDGLVTTLAPTAGEWPQLASCKLTESEAAASINVPVASKAVLSETSFSIGCGLQQALFTKPEELASCWHANTEGFGSEEYGIDAGSLMIDASTPLSATPALYKDLVAYGYKKMRGSTFTITADIEAAMFELAIGAGESQIVAIMGVTPEIDTFATTPLDQTSPMLLIGYQERLSPEDGSFEKLCLVNNEAGGEALAEVPCETLPMMKISYDNGVANIQYSLDDGVTWKDFSQEPLFQNGPEGTADFALVFGVFGINAAEARIYFRDVTVTGDVVLVE